MIRRWLLDPGVVGMVAAVALLQACGGDDKPPPLPFEPGGAGGVGGRGAGGTAGTNGTGGSGAEPNDALAPAVTLLSPGELTDPNAATPDNAVLVKSTVTASCTVEKSAEPDALDVDGESIKIELIKADDTIVDGAVSSTDAFTYTADFSLTDVAAGPVRFRCTASDISIPPKTNQDVNSTFVDHGPRITVIQPLSGAAKPRDSVAFEFTVDPVPLAAGDTGAALGPVSLEVFGVTIPTSLVDGRYRGEANFTDATKFGPALNGAVTVLIKAPNTRTPEPAVANEEYPISVDGDAPVIVITRPVRNYTVVGGRTTIDFDVTDLVSGVNTQKVAVKIHDLEYVSFDANKLDTWIEQAGKFKYTFDARLIPNTNTQINVNIRAEDNAGNVSDLANSGQGLILSLDNVPPIVDLYAGNVREHRRNTPTCSDSFDPLGNTPEDGATIGGKVRIRALAWDDTNHELAPQPGALDYYARVNPQSVFVYLQPNVNTPLLIDADRNGSCESLARTQNFQDLTGFNAAGDPGFGGDTSIPPLLDRCEVGASRPPSTNVCNNLADLKRVIEHTMIVDQGGENVVYGIGGGSGGDCVGGSWDIPSLVPEGWVCVAALAEDTVGNLGISRPLRLCIDKPENGPNPCDDAQKPTCTDGCSLPPYFPAQIISRRP